MNEHIQKKPWLAESVFYTGQNGKTCLPDEGGSLEDGNRSFKATDISTSNPSMGENIVSSSNQQRIFPVSQHPPQNVSSFYPGHPVEFLSLAQIIISISWVLMSIRLSAALGVSYQYMLLLFFKGSGETASKRTDEGQEEEIPPQSAGWESSQGKEDRDSIQGKNTKDSTKGEASSPWRQW